MGKRYNFRDNQDSGQINKVKNVSLIMALSDSHRVSIATIGRQSDADIFQVCRSYKMFLFFDQIQQKLVYKMQN